jgi:hypothetical protein
MLRPRLPSIFATCAGLGASAVPSLRIRPSSLAETRGGSWHWKRSECADQRERAPDQGGDQHRTRASVPQVQQLAVFKNRAALYQGSFRGCPTPQDATPYHAITGDSSEFPRRGSLEAGTGRDRNATTEERVDQVSSPVRKKPDASEIHRPHSGSNPAAPSATTGSARVHARLILQPRPQPRTLDPTFP